jgi:hypothetical protein
MALIKQFVRIHPRTPGSKGGHRVQRYSIYGTLFIEGQWFVAQFSEEQWEYLRNVRTYTEDPDSKLVFDVCTAEEKAEIERKEHQVKVTEVAPATVDLTTKDLRGEQSGQVVEAKDRERDTRLAESDSVEGLAPPVPSLPKKKVGRPRKVVSTTAG